MFQLIKTVQLTGYSAMSASVRSRGKNLPFVAVNSDSLEHNPKAEPLFIRCSRQTGCQDMLRIGS